MKALAALLVVLLACVAAGGAGAQQRHLRVLFVGNSLTATNDLPATVAAIARGVGHTTIDVQMVAPGGYALEDHWANGDALAALRTGRFDVVVLQQGPSSLPESRVNLIEWTKRWADEARAQRYAAGGTDGVARARALLASSRTWCATTATPRGRRTRCSCLRGRRGGTRFGAGPRSASTGRTRSTRAASARTSPRSSRTPA